jgi:hypothetical protein
MPCDHCRWFHDHQNVRLSWPHGPQDAPEEAVDAVQDRSRTFTLQHCDLLTQSNDFQTSIEATSEENSESGENGEQQMEHKSTL